MSRHLLTIERVRALTPIPGADAIETATIRGWNVVVKKGEFQVGDRVAFFEVDSFLPVNDDRFAFLAPRGTRHALVDGVNVEGHVLRTAKLRGQISQGLIIGLDQFPELLETDGPDDLATRVGVTKYEPPIPAALAGQIIGAFPTQFAPKTDAERVQNLDTCFEELAAHPGGWYATAKLDGSSVTVIRDDDGVLRFCSRNWELTPNKSLTVVQVAERDHLTDCLPPGMAFQAELVGPGIQSNRQGMADARLLVFAVLRNRRYLPRHDWPQELLAHAVQVLDLPFPQTVAAAVDQADGLMTDVGGQPRRCEGIVWHTADGAGMELLGGRDCFKAINNTYLLKNG